MKKEPSCASCSMRGKYDTAPRSLVGRFWRWHINFCLGWKAYFTALTEEEKEQMRKQYHFTKYTD